MHCAIHCSDPAICCLEVFVLLRCRSIPINGFVEVSLTADGCRGTSSEVRYLEHVEAVITLSTSGRGQIQLFLTSPSGTRSTLLGRRSRDSSSDGFNAWPFMTTHCWGEDPKGTWSLQARNGDSVGEWVRQYSRYRPSRWF